jgi:hypothetical protein
MGNGNPIRRTGHIRAGMPKPLPRMATVLIGVALKNRHTSPERRCDRSELWPDDGIGIPAAHHRTHTDPKDCEDIAASCHQREAPRSDRRGISSGSVRGEGARDVPIEALRRFPETSIPDDAGLAFAFKEGWREHGQLCDHQPDTEGGRQDRSAGVKADRNRLKPCIHGLSASAGRDRHAGRAPAPQDARPGRLPSVGAESVEAGQLTFMPGCHPARSSVCFILTFMARCHPARSSVCFVLTSMARCHPARSSVCFILAFMARCHPARSSVCFVLTFMARCHPARSSVCFVLRRRTEHRPGKRVGPHAEPSALVLVGETPKRPT